MDQDANLCKAIKKNSTMAISACNQNSDLHQKELRQSKVSWNKSINWKKNPSKPSKAVQKFQLTSFKQFLNPKTF